VYYPATFAFEFCGLFDSIKKGF